MQTEKANREESVMSFRTVSRTENAKNAACQWVDPDTDTVELEVTWKGMTREEADSIKQEASLLCGDGFDPEAALEQAERYILAGHPLPGDFEEEQE
jgi:hypothetical protein